MTGPMMPFDTGLPDDAERSRVTDEATSSVDPVDPEDDGGTQLRGTETLGAEEGAP